MPDPRIAARPIEKMHGNVRRVESDHVAVEEPLEIRIAYGSLAARIVRPISITMRTPGHDPSEDIELALGFLLSEGIIRQPHDVQRAYHCGPESPSQRLQNVIRVELDPTLQFDIARLDRHFYTTSSCGVCGKTSLETLRTLCPPIPDNQFTIESNVLHALPELLRATQSVFDSTGGLHAAALFDRNGKLQAMREDIGRHNALDKLIGSQFLTHSSPITQSVLLLSGRASFELLQKSAMAAVPIVAAVGTPSSLAIDIARQFNITLLGFLRNNRFNIYSGAHRILSAAVDAAPRGASGAPIQLQGTSHA